MDPPVDKKEQEEGALIADITYTYNERQQLTSSHDSVTGAHVDYAYDADGNLISEDEGGVLHTRIFSYDAHDRLIRLDVPGQAPITFDYQSDGLRIAKHQGNSETRYQYDQGSLLAETNAIGNTTARYHYSDTQLLSRTKVGSTPEHVHYLLDALQNPIATLSQQGAVLSRTLYDAWGRIVAQQDVNGVVTRPNTNGPHAELTNADEQPIGFTGYYKDTESGLYYAKARYYDPAHARFTTEDPEEGNVMRPPSLHRYLYAYANPTTHIDPTGRITEELLNQELSDVASGKLSAAEFRERTQARGVGTLVVLAARPLAPLAADTFILGGTVVADAIATGSLWTGLTLNAAGLTTTGVVAVEVTAAIATGTIAPSVLPLNAMGAEGAQAQVAVKDARAAATVVETPVANSVISIQQSTVGAVETVLARQSPMRLGTVFEDNGVVKAASEAFQRDQMTRRMSVRAFDNNGNLLPGRTQLDAAGNRLDSGQFGALERRRRSWQQRANDFATCRFGA